MLGFYVIVKMLSILTKKGDQAEPVLVKAAAVICLVLATIALCNLGIRGIPAGLSVLK